MRALSGKTYPGATGDSLVLFDGKDLKAKPQITMAIHCGQAAKVSGQTAILSLPPSFGSMVGLQTLAAQLESGKHRVYPIDAASVIGPVVGVSELVLQLPDGWRPAFRAM